MARGPLWTAREDRVVGQHLVLKGERVLPGTWQRVASQIGRTAPAVRYRAHVLRDRGRRPWRWQLFDAGKPYPPARFSWGQWRSK